MAGKYTTIALLALLAHVEEMQETIQLALAGNADALKEIEQEYYGMYTKASRLACEVGGGHQMDDDVEAEEAYAKWLEAEEAIRARQSERG